MRGKRAGTPREVRTQFRLWLDLMQAHGLSTATMLGSIEGLGRAAKARAKTRAKTHLKGQ